MSNQDGSKTQEQLAFEIIELYPTPEDQEPDEAARIQEFANNLAYSQEALEKFSDLVNMNLNGGWGPYSLDEAAIRILERACDCVESGLLTLGDLKRLGELFKVMELPHTLR